MENKDIWQKIGIMIKNARLSKGLKQKDIADYLGVKINTISDYETGKRKVDLEMLKKLANFLNVSTDYLLGRVEIKNYNYRDNEHLYIIYKILIENKLINENDDIETIQKKIEKLKVCISKVKEICVIRDRMFFCK